MSRSGYRDDCDGWYHVRWRGAVASSIRGKRGQQFLRDLVEALDAMPVKRLARNVFEQDGEVCTIAALGKRRGIDMSNWDAEYTDNDAIAEAFGVARPLVLEIEDENDNAGPWKGESPEERWVRMRGWVASLITNLKGA